MKENQTSQGFPDGLAGKEFTCLAGDTGDVGMTPGGKSSRGGNVNSLQYSCLENPTDIGAWWATVPRITKTQAGLSN